MSKTYSAIEGIIFVIQFILAYLERLGVKIFSNGVSCMRDPYWSRKGTFSYMSVLYCSLFMLAAEEMC